jgi:hypothetical protein
MRRADRFVIHFAILFLTVLLAMFGLYYLLDYYQGTPVEGGGALNFTDAFRVNLFLIDLSLLLVIESVLILLFVRYTAPALIASSAVVLVFAAVGGRSILGGASITVLLAPLARNGYAALGLRHVVLLLALNALLLAFLVAMMHHYQQLDQDRETAARELRTETAAEAPTAQTHDRGEGTT